MRPKRLVSDRAHRRGVLPDTGSETAAEAEAQAQEAADGPHASFELVDKGDGEVVVWIAGELDISNLPALADRVSVALSNGPRRLVIDASGVRFADSSAIAQWLQWSMAVQEFELRDPPVVLRAVITAMGLAQQLGMPD
jgi:anti-anti-sigma regulatory factor